MELLLALPLLAFAGLFAGGGTGSDDPDDDQDPALAARDDADTTRVGATGDDRMRGTGGADFFRGRDGDDTLLGRGDADVIVSDGFTGNIALKSVEGTARFVADLLKRAFSSSTRSKIGFLISRPATELLKHHLDPNIHNGAVFLGLNGIVVKSHGSASEVGVETAIGVAAKMVRDDLTRRISEDLGNFEAQAA